MSYPPQQPGSYGQHPYGGQQPPQPPQQPQYGGQSSYQGLGTFSGGEPPKRNTGKIIAIVVIVLLVLGGGGVALVVLNKDSDKSASSGDKTSEAPSTQDSADNSGGDSSAEEPTDDGDGGASNSPDDVRDAYMAAYENKSFHDVVENACQAYKAKYGTDTSKLEQTLQPYDVTATPDGDPDVNGNTARANIDLALSQGGTTERPKIFIKIVEENGQWRFCGEGEAS